MSTRGISTTQNCHRHPHVHMIVPGGGFSLDKARWVAPLQLPRACQCTGARVSRQDAGDAHGCARQRPIDVLNTHAGLTEKRTFKRFIAALRRIHWVVHCKAPFAGPEQVLRYLSRYTLVSPSRTAASLQPTTPASRSVARTIASTARVAGRRCGFTRTSSSGAS